MYITYSIIKGHFLSYHAYSIWCGRLKIPWVHKSVGSGFLLLILFIIYHRRDITEILLQWRKTTNKPNLVRVSYMQSSVCLPLGQASISEQSVRFRTQQIKEWWKDYIKLEWAARRRWAGLWASLEINCMILMGDYKQYVSLQWLR